MLFPLFSSFVVVVMFQMVQIHFLYQQTTWLSITEISRKKV
jgi:hypothetical protein